MFTIITDSFLNSHCDNIENEIECYFLVKEFMKVYDNDSSGVKIVIYTGGKMLLACELLSEVIYCLGCNNVIIETVELNDEEVAH